MSSHQGRLLVFALVVAVLASPVMNGCRAAETQAAEVQAGDTPESGGAPAAGPQTVEGMYMGLSGGPLGQATVADLPEGVVLQSGDLTVTREQIDTFIAEHTDSPEAAAALQAEAFFVAEQLALEPLLEREALAWAAEQGQASSDAVIDAHLQSIADGVTVTDQDVRAFYDENVVMFDGAPYEQVAEQLRSMVLRDKQQEAVTGHINSVSERQPVTVDASFLAEVAPKAFDNPVDQARRSGKPTFVDFGSEGCGPCDMMAPIIDELRTELGDRANVVMVQVREEQYLSARYGIRSIPVQVFFDAEGREIFRHTGFLPKQEIMKQLAEMGVE